MYVNPFWFGVATTISVEAILFLVVGLWAASKRLR